MENKDIKKVNGDANISKEVDNDTYPNIDSDFGYENREQVINYVQEKYGKDKVAKIIK